MKYRCALCARFGLRGGGDTPRAFALHMLRAHGVAVSEQDVKRQGRAATKLLPCAKAVAGATALLPVADKKRRTKRPRPKARQQRRARQFSRVR
jgi:hypothetical protein